MKNSRLHLLLGRGVEELAKSFWLWLFSLLLLGLPIMGTAHLAFDSLASLSLNIATPPVVAWLFLSSAYFCFMGKYFLTLSRNPALVKKYPWQAVKYSLTDGALLRLLYSFLAAGLRLAGFYLYTFIYAFLGRDTGYGTGFLFEPLLAIVLPSLYLLLIDSRLFLLSYIIQDSYSKDNLKPALSFPACIRKSFQLMSDYFADYAWISLLQYLLLRLHYAIVANAFERVFYDWGRTPEAYLVFWLGQVLFVGTLAGIFLALRIKWADLLMEFDREIVDFGDD